MRIAALYDIHGNLPALEAVLAEIREMDVDLIVIGGDVVPGPMPGEVLAALGRLPAPARFLYGNGERDVLATCEGRTVDRVPESVHEVLRWAAEALTSAETELLRAWPATVSLEVEGAGKVLFCHATPRSATEIFTSQTPEERLRPIFDPFGADVVVCGHTHMQFDRRIRTGRERRKRRHAVRGARSMLGHPGPGRRAETHRL